MKIKKIILIFSIFLMTGCYDTKELNNIAILTATEINKIDNMYVVNIEVANPQAPDKTVNAEAPFIIYTGTGKTIQEAYRQTKLTIPRYLYPEHLQLLIINESIAKEDITEIIDFYLRNPALRSEFYIVIGKTKDILSPTTQIDQISSSSIVNTIKTNQKYLGTANLTTLNELANMILNPNLEVILPSIKYTEKNEKKNTNENTESTKNNNKYELSGLAIFKSNKLKGYLTNNESITYNLIKNNTKNSILNYECEKDKYLTIEIITNKSTIKIKEEAIIINIDIEGTINENNCQIYLDKKENITKLEKELTKYLNNRITNDINNIKNTYNSDVFGFLDEIFKHDYNRYLKVKDNWYQSEYQNSNIKINSKVSIIGKGNTMEANNEKD